MKERILFILFTLIGFYFCFDLGYYLTGNFGATQLIGIPFAIVLAILNVITILNKQTNKRIFRTLSIGYTLSIVLFVLIILLIKRNGASADYYLYYPQKNSYSILLWTLGIGFAATLIIMWYYLQKTKASNQQP